jgi:hypothetical protein
MTSQPAIQGSLFFTVTLEAKAHLKRDPPEPVHGLHSPVAFLAVDLFFDVPFMIEKNMLRQIIDFNPRGRCPVIEIFMLFPDFRMIGNDIFMTVKAFLYGWNTGKGRTTHIGMTESALDVLHAGMDPVTEGDRLCRTETCRRINVKKIEKAHKKTQAA